MPYTPAEYIGLIIIIIVIAILFVIGVALAVVGILRRRRLGRTLQTSDQYVNGPGPQRANNPEPNRPENRPTQTETTGNEAMRTPSSERSSEYR